MSARDLPELRSALHGAIARLHHSVEIVAQTAARPSRPPRKAQSASPIRVRLPRQTTVLVVEDDEATGRLYIEALHGMRAHVRLCPTMVEAREAIGAMVFDVAVIDLVMREDVSGGLANGAELIPLLHRASPETRIVVSTGLQDAAAHEMLLAAGADPSTVEIVAKVPAHEIRAVVGVR